jgi:hypothetical protein
MATQTTREDRRYSDACELCRRPARYRFGSDGAGIDRCLRHAVLYPPVRQRAVRVALVVGSVLFLINQADIVARGDLSAIVAVKVGLTYLVPYSVSTYSALQINLLTNR